MSFVPPPPRFVPEGNPKDASPQTETGLASLPEKVNPGQFEELHSKATDILLEPFEGIKVQTQHFLHGFLISPTLVLNNPQTSSFNFNLNYIGDPERQKTSPHVGGYIDFSGNFVIQAVHQFNKNINGKAIGQMKGWKLNVGQLVTEYTNDNFSASGVFAISDPFTYSGMAVASVLYSFKRNLAAGCQILHQRVSGNSVTMISLGGRYIGDRWQASATLSPLAGEMKLSYYQKPRTNLQIGAEFDINLLSRKCTTRAGYQIDLPLSDTVYKGQIDSNFVVSATMEKKMNPLPFVFSLSAIVDSFKGIYRFGIGLAGAM